MEISPISTKRIYQSIIEQFIEHIRNGKLKVGQKLPPERSLAEMFQVSRASIREAFSAMEVIGLIEVRPGEGSMITGMNIAPFINTISPLLIKNEHMENELLEFRKMIELQAVELAAKKHTHEKLSTVIMNNPDAVTVIDIFKKSSTGNKAFWQRNIHLPKRFKIYALKYALSFSCV